MSIKGPAKNNKTGKATINDLVMTPDDVAAWIVNHFMPSGKVLEPCRGNGSFTKLLPDADWFEILEGRDFLLAHGKWDWIITNPPYSIYDLFLIKSLQCADNVVFLAPLQKAFKSQKIDKAISNFGGLAEIVMLGSGSKAGFPFGFPVGCLYYKRDYSGPIKLTRAYSGVKGACE